MDNYIIKFSCLYIEQRNYLSGPLVYRVLSNPISYGAQWLSGRVLDLRPRGRGFEPHWLHCVVVLEQEH